MKAVCSKHVQAYDVSAGCPYCEPARARATGAELHAMGANAGAPSALNQDAALSPSSVPPQGFDSRKLTVDDMMRLARFYAL